METRKSFSDELKELFAKAAVRKVVDKGEFLLRAGAVEKNLYLVKSGAVRAFFLTEMEALTIRFGYAGSMITSLSSFLTGRPSEIYLEAIRKTTVLAVSKTDMLRLVAESEENLRQYVRLLEELVVQQIDREIDLLITSPTARFQRVMERSPALFQEIPLKHIASYLRMTPETLSRIRKS